MKKQPQKKQSSRNKTKKPDLKIKKQAVKDLDLDPDKASQKIKGGQKCTPTVCINTCGGIYSY